MAMDTAPRSGPSCAGVIVHGDDQIRALWATGHGFKDSYDDMNFTPPLLSTITARTLIVHGDRDPLYPVPLALEIYSAIPHSLSVGGAERWTRPDLR